MLERFCIPTTVNRQGDKLSSDNPGQPSWLRQRMVPWLGVILLGLIGVSGVSGAQISLEKTGSANSTGSSEIVAQDDVIDWVIELSHVEPTLNNVTLTDTFIGDHTFVPGSLLHSGEFDFSEATLDATSTALTGTADVISKNVFSTVETLEKSLEVESFQFPTATGDGWKVVFHSPTNRIFFTAHHWNEFSTNCFSTLTGEACPGYPKSLTSEGRHVSTASNNRGYEIFGNHLYFAGRQTGTGRYGVSCWDVISESECGFTLFGNTSVEPVTNQDDPLVGFGKVSDTEWWLIDQRLTAHCFNPTTNTACGGTASIAFADQVIVVADQETHRTATTNGGSTTRLSTLIEM